MWLTGIRPIINQDIHKRKTEQQQKIHTHTNKHYICRKWAASGLFVQREFVFLPIEMKLQKKNRFKSIPWQKWNKPNFFTNIIYWFSWIKSHFSACYLWSVDWFGLNEKKMTEKKTREKQEEKKKNEEKWRKMKEKKEKEWKKLEQIGKKKWKKENENIDTKSIWCAFVVRLKRWKSSKLLKRWNKNVISYTLELSLRISVFVHWKIGTTSSKRNQKKGHVDSHKMFHMYIWVKVPFIKMDVFFPTVFVCRFCSRHWDDLWFTNMSIEQFNFHFCNCIFICDCSSKYFQVKLN